MPKGRAETPEGALAAAVDIGRRALRLIAADTVEAYLQNEERQLAVERLLMMFGEALKDVPVDTLSDIDPLEDWRGPKGFRDIAAHWYADYLDHRLIWQTVTELLPPVLKSIETWLARKTSA